MRNLGAKRLIFNIYQNTSVLKALFVEKKQKPCVKEFYITKSREDMREKMGKAWSFPPTRPKFEF